jgi:hypothetical protein
MIRAIGSRRTATLVAATSLAVSGLAALPAVNDAGLGPAQAEAHMIPLPGWWSGKVICMPGQPLEEAGFCGGEQELA